MQIGDLVAAVTTKIGIKKCIPCKARQAKMNNMQEKFTGSISQLSKELSSKWQSWQGPSSSSGG